MSNQITLTGGGIQDAAGNILVSGSLVLSLSNDAQAIAANKLISANIPIVIPLDASGNVSGTVKVWGNTQELTPSGTAYNVMAFTASGAQAWRTTQSWVFSGAGGSSIDIGTLVPTASSVSYADAVVKNPIGPQTIAGALTVNSLTSGGIVDTVSVTSPAFKSSSANPADSGSVRLANNESIRWRNAANNGNHGWKLNASDQLESGATGGLLLTGASGFLRLGGTTSSFPMIKPSSTAIGIRLADDSGDADLTAKILTLSDTLVLSTANKGVEVGAKNSANTPFIDFNSSGNNNDFDSRIIASAGTTQGTGTLDVQAALFAVTGNVSASAGNILLSSGKVTKYNNISTVGDGIPYQVATVDLTGQTAAKTTTTLFTPTATGLFQIFVYLKITTAGTSPVLGPVTIAYTDGTDSVAQSNVLSLVTQAGAAQATGNSGNTTTSVLCGMTTIYAKTGVAITYAIALTGTAGTVQYEAHLRAVALG